MWCKKKNTVHRILPCSYNWAMMEEKKNCNQIHIVRSPVCCWLCSWNINKGQWLTVNFWTSLRFGEVEDKWISWHFCIFQCSRYRNPAWHQVKIPTETLLMAARRFSCCQSVCPSRLRKSVLNFMQEQVLEVSSKTVLIVYLWAGGVENERISELHTRAMEPNVHFLWDTFLFSKIVMEAGMEQIIYCP